MDSSAVFWIIAFLMSAFAIGFVAVPLIKRGDRFGIAGFGAVLSVFAVGLYLFVGSPQAASLDYSDYAGDTVERRSTAQHRKPAASVASLVDGLAERLNNDGRVSTDGKSWLLLARSYSHLGRLPEATEAYDRAAALGEYDEELATLAGDPVAASGAQLRGKVSLSTNAQNTVLPTDTVFVFARAINGPPVPVAATQRRASELPFDFVLSDRQSISPDAMLSGFETVAVTARISRPGVATPALKDLKATSPEITVTSGDHINLIIE